MSIDKRHYKREKFSQRMTRKEWKEILLNHDEKIIYKGNVITLKADDIGFGVVDVYKDLNKKPNREEKKGNK